MSRATVASPMNREIIESTYQQWRLDPSSVDPSWSFFFEGFEAGLAASVAPGQEGNGHAIPPSQSQNGESKDARDHLGISRLIHRYRDLGHLVADLNPLYPAPDKNNPLLAIEQFNLSSEDLGRHFDCSGFFGLGKVNFHHDGIHHEKETDGNGNGHLINAHGI